MTHASFELCALSSVVAILALFCGLGVGAEGCAADAAGGGMNLKQALTYALAHSPDLAKARQSELVSDLQNKNATAKLYPSLDLTTSQGVNGQAPQALPKPRSPLFGQADLALSETFYDSGQTLLGVDIATANYEAARLTVLKTRDDLILEVAKAFYAFEQSDLLLQTKKQQYDLLNQQFRQMGSLYRQGLRTSKDYQRFQSQVQKAEIDVITAESAQRTAEIALLRVIGASGADQGLTFESFKPEQALALAPTFPDASPDVTKSYVFRLAEMNDRSAASNVELARRKNLPVFTVATGVNLKNSDYVGQFRPFDSPLYGQVTTGWNLTVGVTYNLWDAGTRRRDIAIASGQRQVLSEEARGNLIQLAADIKTMMTSLASLKKTFLLNKQLMKLQEENFRNLESDFREGKVAYLDLVTALADRLQAKVDFYSTYVSILQTLAQYRYYEGTIYDSLASP